MSDLVWATRGIVAGSGGATSEMRLVMIGIVDQALLVYPTVTPTLFVDDLSEELDGEDDEIVNFGGFLQLVVDRITTDGMEVSANKPRVSASHPDLGYALEDRTHLSLSWLGAWG